MIATMPGDRLDDQFIRLVDELVVSAGKDPELIRGLKWIDMQSRKNGISFYEMAFMVLKKHEAENRARQWLKNKESS